MPNPFSFRGSLPATFVFLLGALGFQVNAAIPQLKNIVWDAKNQSHLTVVADQFSVTGDITEALKGPVTLEAKVAGATDGGDSDSEPNRAIVQAYNAGEAAFFSVILMAADEKNASIWFLAPTPGYYQIINCQAIVDNKDVASLHLEQVVTGLKNNNPRWGMHAILWTVADYFNKNSNKTLNSYYLLVANNLVGQPASPFACGGGAATAPTAASVASASAAPTAPTSSGETAASAPAPAPAPAAVAALPMAPPPTAPIPSNSSPSAVYGADPCQSEPDNWHYNTCRYRLTHGLPWKPWQGATSSSGTVIVDTAELPPAAPPYPPPRVLFVTPGYRLRIAPPIVMNNGFVVRMGRMQRY